LHRDLKPSNILRDVDGKWMLADFGISWILTPDEKSTVSSKMMGTVTGEPLNRVLQMARVILAKYDTGKHPTFR
jgi:serine/threonine protein kinase